MSSGLIEQLSYRGARFQVLHHGPAHAGVQEALAVGAPLGEVLKTVVLDTTAGHALAVIPANRHLDMKRVRAAVADRRAHLASESEIETDLPGCELGAIAPLGSVIGVATYVDPEVLQHPTVVFPAGSSTTSIRGALDQLFSGEDVTITPLTQREPEGLARSSSTT